MPFLDVSGKIKDNGYTDNIIIFSINHDNIGLLEERNGKTVIHLKGLQYNIIEVAQNIETIRALMSDHGIH